MRSGNDAPKNIGDYISSFTGETRDILKEIRATIRKAAPNAQEVISYRMPAFKLNAVIVYFAAFKNHIGLYPPVRGDAKLMKAISRYAGEKGNLRFPLDEPIPYGLIEKITKAQIKADQLRAKSKRTKKIK